MDLIAGARQVVCMHGLTEYNFLKRIKKKKEEAVLELSD